MTRADEAYMAALTAGCAALSEIVAAGGDPVVAGVVAQAAANQAYADRMTAHECPACGVPVATGLLVEVDGGLAGDCAACGESIEVRGVVRLIPRERTTVKRPASHKGGGGWTR